MARDETQDSRHGSDDGIGCVRLLVHIGRRARASMELHCGGALCAARRSRRYQITAMVHFRCVHNRVGDFGRMALVYLGHLPCRVLLDYSVRSDCDFLGSGSRGGSDGWLLLLRGVALCRRRVGAT